MTTTDDTTHVATCRTEGCGNADHPIPLVIRDDDGAPITAPAVFCGACSQPITDVTEA